MFTGQIKMLKIMRKGVDTSTEFGYVVCVVRNYDRRGGNRENEERNDK